MSGKPAGQVAEAETVTTTAICALEDLPVMFNAAVDLLTPNLAAGRGERVAVIDAQGATTYQDLHRRVCAFAARLQALGVQREQRVLLCLTDTVDFHVAFLGAIWAGVVPVPVNTMLTPSDYRWMLADSRARVVAVSGSLADRWTAIADDELDVQFLSSRGGPWPPMLPEGVAPLAKAVETHRDEPAFWLYSSGSTGNPKGVVHRHASMRLTAELYGREIVGYRSDDVVHSVAKLFFAYGLGNGLSFPMSVGATVVLNEDRPLPAAVAELISVHGVTIFNAVPTFFASLLATLDDAALAGLRGLRLATSAGEALPEHVGAAFRDRVGADILDGLGSTEMLHIFLSQRQGAVRYGVTGRAVPGYEVEVVDDAGRPAPSGEPGDLVVRGPTAASSYWNNRAKTLSAFQGEWTRTGDKYIRDEDGWFKYCGRTDDMLKVGGIYVSPIEVEEALASHVAVLECAVVGADDDAGLVKPKAYVVLKPGAAGDVELELVLKAHVRALLAPYKYPRWLVFVEELPKTATGKIQRFKLRDLG